MGVGAIPKGGQDEVKRHASVDQGRNNMKVRISFRRPVLYQTDGPGKPGPDCFTVVSVELEHSLQEGSGTGETSDY